jgi:hypothetical protein
MYYKIDGALHQNHFVVLPKIKLIFVFCCGFIQLSVVNSIVVAAESPFENGVKLSAIRLNSNSLKVHLFFNIGRRKLIIRFVKNNRAIKDCC